MSDAMNMGYKIADELTLWRPDMDTGDVVSAIMHGLERYSTQTEGASEANLKAVVYKLHSELEARMRSF